MKVWEALFPHYYTTPLPPLPDYSDKKHAAAPAYNEATGEYVAPECEKETAYAAP